MVITTGIIDSKRGLKDIFRGYIIKETINGINQLKIHILLFLLLGSLLL